MKTSAPKRDWSEARDKVEEEGRCRVCLVPDGSYVDGERVYLEAAHIIGREHDEVIAGPKGGKTLVVGRDSVVPLCRSCHAQYHAHRLDLLPYLFLPEQVEAVRASAVRVYEGKTLVGEGGPGWFRWLSGGAEN